MRSILRLVVDYLGYLAVRLLVCVVEALPLELCVRLARRLALLFCDVVPIRRAVVDDNLSHAFPELDERGLRGLRLGMWEHLFVMFIEMVHARRKIHETNWRDYIELDRADEIIRAAFDDRPTLLICGHYGNFELSAYILGLLGFPTWTIARPLDNPFLDRYVNQFRGATGQRILSKSGSSGQIDAVLESRGILAILGDQHAGPKGCWVDFFGRPASSHKAIALFALSSEANAVFCYTRRVGGPLRLRVGSAGRLDPRTMGAEMRTVPAIIGWYTRLLEHTIRQAPEQYWWVHRRWKDNRPRRAGGQRERAA